MTLIRMHFLQTLNATYTEVSQRLTAATAAGSKGGSANLSETALNALLYAKFSSISEISRSLLYELEKRANANPSEYGSLLQECFSNWFNVRTQLLAPSLAEEVRRMDPQNTDLVKLVSRTLVQLPALLSSWTGSIWLRVPAKCMRQRMEALSRVLPLFRSNGIVSLS